jgi:outer membrane protein OmpA-like peptidoglycan-associated protein
MSLQLIKTTLPVLFVTIACWSQTPPPHPDTVPIYHVTVIDRTVSAVNYQYRGWPTQIDFKGTVLLPQAKGDAIVESKSGRTDIDARFRHLEAPQRFGSEYLTYVLWAITPEGHVKNLGEVMADAADNAHLHVTTDLQAFGLIMTAEPYNSVRLPSDVVVAENQVRADTIGSAQPIHARFELLPRGTYTYNVPADLRAFNEGPKVSMDKYEQIVEIYQAQNAVQIAQSQGADQYAPDVIAKARQELANAQQMQVNHGGRSMVVTMARAAAETAEDARELSIKRQQDTEIAQAQDTAARERKLREEAEDRAVRARAEAERANAEAEQANADANANREALDAERAQRAALIAQPAAPPPPQPQSYVEPPAPNPNQARAAARAALLQQLRGASGGAVEVIDAPRGLVLMVPDADFRGGTLSSPVAATLARVAPLVARTPGLTVEVDGYTDVGGAERESVAAERAERVRGALVRQGLSGSTVIARGMGNSHPLGSNAGAADREQNRRVEIVISGGVIGNLPLWDKTYTLSRDR